MNVTIFGLGLNGGGVSAARYFAARGCRVTVTDLREESELTFSLKKLKGLPGISYTLGEHRKEDICSADLVIKNTAVPPDHPLLAYAGWIETDLSWYLKRSKRPIIAVTGTKGKTAASYLLSHLIRPQFPRHHIAGNMGISLFDIPADSHTAPVILEVSSWQLRDLKYLSCPLNTQLSLLTSLFPDHLNSYKEFSSYITDKAYAFQAVSQAGILPAESLSFPEILSPASRTAELYTVGEAAGYKGIYVKGTSWILSRVTQDTYKEIPAPPLPPSVYEQTALCALLASFLLGIPLSEGISRIRQFPGLSHRMQYVAAPHGIPCYNDSASTVPEATEKAVHSFPGKHVHLIAGGTDKGLSTEPFRRTADSAASVHLLSGSFTQRLIQEEIFPNACGPFQNMEDAFMSACRTAGQGSGGIILLSPGASSFEYFCNEFDRGDQFIRCVLALSGTSSGHG